MLYDVFILLEEESDLLREMTHFEIHVMEALLTGISDAKHFVPKRTYINDHPVSLNWWLLRTETRKLLQHSSAPLVGV